MSAKTVKKDNLDRSADLYTEKLARFDELLHEVSFAERYGRVVQVLGTIIWAVAPNVVLGELCRLENRKNGVSLLAEVIGFKEDQVILTPLGHIDGLSADTLVIPTGKSQSIAVGQGLLGRVVNGLGEPIDGLGPLSEVPYAYTVAGTAPSPMTRQLIEKPLALGIKVIDTLLTCGEGQRMGVFAAAGVGKSTLLGMLANAAGVDVIVVALIGERGREVREFIEHELGESGLARTVVVVATSDRPAIERVKSAQVATSIAEYFRDQGQRVLLLMDSVTRYARAQREIGLAAGEPPTRRGFPPSVFADLPRLLERSGQSDKGSITGLYTVLVEGDDMSEPIADEVRSILDGHIVLSRTLAANNHYPAVDVLESISRVMGRIVSQEHLKAAAKLRVLLAKYKEIELLIKLGEYKAGSDPTTDEAVQKMPMIEALVKQSVDDPVDYEQSVGLLKQLCG